MGFLLRGNGRTDNTLPPLMLSNRIDSAKRRLVEEALRVLQAEYKNTIFVAVPRGVVRALSESSIWESRGRGRWTVRENAS
jgi:hypothetical protein